MYRWLHTGSRLASTWALSVLRPACLFSLTWDEGFGLMCWCVVQLSARRGGGFLRVFSLVSSSLRDFGLWRLIGVLEWLGKRYGTPTVYTGCFFSFSFCLGPAFWGLGLGFHFIELNWMLRCDGWMRWGEVWEVWTWKRALNCVVVARFLSEVVITYLWSYLVLQCWVRLLCLAWGYVIS